MRQTRAFGGRLLTGADRVGEAADVRRRAGRPVGVGAVVGVMVGGLVALLGAAAVAGAAAGVAVRVFLAVAGF